LRRVSERQRGDGDGQPDDGLARVRSGRDVDRVDQIDGARRAQDRAMSVARIDPGAEILRIRPDGEMAPDASSPSGPSFADLLTSAVDAANHAGHVADAKADAVARGTLDDLHGTMISAKEAEISLRLVGAVRNKLLDAFHELWRTGL